MLNKFNAEHWHDEDEVRFIVEGRGLFHIHPPDGPVFAIEVEAGDLIRVPRGTHHWFDLCADRRIRAIRLFQDPSGWTPHYTGTRRRQALPAGLLRAGVLPDGTSGPRRLTIRLADRGIRVVLLDIEGTTTPIAFVHDVLFPFARAHLAAFLRAHAGDAEVGRGAAAARARVRRRSRARRDRRRDGAFDVERRRSRRTSTLADGSRSQVARAQAAAGQIWEAGYRAGELRGQVYPDVPPAIRRWRAAGLRVAIYSSGSELAQRRLFESTEHGDLTPLLSGFFDTGVGAKVASESYAPHRRGARRAAGRHPVRVGRHTRADGRARGRLQVVLSLRPGNSPQPDAEQFERS